jgi:CRP-like cAMP-binding protein
LSKPVIDPVATLGGISLFIHLSARQLKRLYHACTHRMFDPGETIVEQGNAGVGMFIILEGTVRLGKTLKDGSMVELGTSSAGDVIGEMSLLDGASRTANVSAVSPVRCLVLSSWAFKAVLESKPEIALGILPVVVQRYRESAEALAEYRSKAKN